MFTSKIVKVYSLLKPHIANMIILILFVTGIMIFYKQILHKNFYDLVNPVESMPLQHLFFAIIFIIAGYILVYAFRQSKSNTLSPSSEQYELINKIVNLQHDADTNLVFTEDKSLLLGTTKKAFIMYGVQGHHWISLGGPVGPNTESYELLWQFKKKANSNHAHAVFYKVDSEHLNWYVNAGFSLFKLGEEAVIDLPSFSLEEGEHNKLRHTQRRATRNGLTFNMSYPPHSPALLAQMKYISSEWLKDKKVTERGFSLGNFDNKYLNRFPIALVIEQGRLSAFANILTTETKQKSTIDLIRHNNDATQTTIEFLFIELMLKLKEQGYASFSFGLAPLSGLEQHQGSRKGDKFGTYLYKNGTDFYNFDGLRSFKNKFNPEWKPKYLAIQQGKNPYQTMVDIGALINKNNINI